MGSGSHASRSAGMTRPEHDQTARRKDRARHGRVARHRRGDRIGAGAGRRARRPARAYWGPYAISKAALETLARTYAAETESTAVRVNLLNPGPIRTRMRAQAMPGEDPAKLDKPHQVAEKILELCLPSFTQTGKLYDYRTKTLMEFRRPAPSNATQGS